MLERPWECSNAAIKISIFHLFFKLNVPLGSLYAF